jgi:hypothetical protein
MCETPGVDLRSMAELALFPQKSARAPAQRGLLIYLIPSGMRSIIQKKMYQAITKCCTKRILTYARATRKKIFFGSLSTVSMVPLSTRYTKTYSKTPKPDFYRLAIQGPIFLCLIQDLKAVVIGMVTAITIALFLAK